MEYLVQIMDRGFVQGISALAQRQWQDTKEKNFSRPFRNLVCITIDDSFYRIGFGCVWKYFVFSWKGGLGIWVAGSGTLCASAQRMRRNMTRYVAGKRRNWFVPSATSFAGGWDAGPARSGGGHGRTVAWRRSTPLPTGPAYKSAYKKPDASLPPK